MTSQRFLYYTGWCITDGSVIASGLGYKGQDPTTGKHSFDKITSVRILNVELGLSPQTMIQVISIVLIDLALESHDPFVAQTSHLQ